MTKLKQKFKYMKPDAIFDLSEMSLICSPSHKYRDVDLCLKWNQGMNVAIAEIKLYDSSLFIDADYTFESATELGNLIADRYNSHEKLKKEIQSLKQSLKDFDIANDELRAENKELRDAQEWVSVSRICEHCNKDFTIKTQLQIPVNSYVINMPDCTHCRKRNDVWVRIDLTSTPKDKPEEIPLFKGTLQELEEL